MAATLATALDRLVLMISAAMAIFAGLLLAALYVIVQYEVFTRFVLHAPTHWTHEVSTFAISWVGLLAAPYVLRLGSHLEVDLVTMRLPRGARNALGVATDLLGAGFCAFAAWGGAGFVELAHMMEATSASELDTPLWIPYLGSPVAFGLLALEFVARAVARTGLVRGREATTTAIHI